MVQEITAVIGGKTDRLLLPDHREDVMPGVEWGHHYTVFTPAFWATLAWLDRDENTYQDFRIGETLEEEIAACLLGGHGIPAEVGLAAFYKVRDCGLLLGNISLSEEMLYEALSEPLVIGDRTIRYRFARQRSRYLSAALHSLNAACPPSHDDLAFRQWLLNLSGVGPKTASWITRNWLKSDNVAIIDIHIHRAGLLMGLYRPEESPAKHYFGMEEKFIAFARNIGVKASILDALIWRQMKDAGNLVLNLLRRFRG